MYTPETGKQNHAHDTDVAIVGAGPAGMVAACILARAGAQVLVLEQNADFSREFRGEILQPRFQQAMKEAGLYEHLKTCPHEEINGAQVYFQGLKVGSVDATWLDKRNPKIWWMTQPNLLAGLNSYAGQFPGYDIWFSTRATALLGDGELTVRTGDQEMQVKAKVILAADGRASSMARLADFEVAYDHHDFDVVWFLLERPPHYTHYFSFFLGLRQPFLILPKHPNKLQCGMVFRPGGFRKIKDQGIEAMKARLASGHPLFRDFAASLTDFSPFHLLRGNRALVKRWVKNGVVLIGDAAHTCSPAGGIGVSIATETAIVAADVILEGLQRGDLSDGFLSRIQALRWSPVREVHTIQGRARFFLHPLFWPLRLLVPVFAPLLSVTKILPLAARQILTQRWPLRNPQQDS